MSNFEVRLDQIFEERKGESNSQRPYYFSPRNPLQLLSYQFMPLALS